jgi:hypothetical protein
MHMEQTFGFGKYESCICSYCVKYRSAIGQEVVMPSTNWSENRGVISGRLSHNLSYVTFLPFFLEETGDTK